MCFVVYTFKHKSHSKAISERNSLLSKDYEYCIEICETDFSMVTESDLFEGNMLRFRALALEQLVV